MAIIIKTDDPIGLLTIIKTAIKDKKVPAWSIDDKEDFAYLLRKYIFQAWFRPRIHQDGLRFGILGRNDKALSADNYAAYHGAFIEMLLKHFDQSFHSVAATAQYDEPDNYEVS